MESGVDVFDGACVYTATERGCGFTYCNTWSSGSLSEEEEERDYSASDDAGREIPPFEIDLNDEK